MARVDKISPKQKMPEYYADFPMNMERNAVTGQLSRLVNEEAVRQSIVNLVLTGMSERPYQPWLGSKIKQSLFDNIDDELVVDAIETSIKDCIKNNETRAEVLKVNLESVPDKNGYNVEVIFSIINITAPQTATFFLSRVR